MAKRSSHSAIIVFSALNSTPTAGPAAHPTRAESDAAIEGGMDACAACAFAGAVVPTLLEAQKSTIAKDVEAVERMPNDFAAWLDLLCSAEPERRLPNAKRSRVFPWSEPR